MYRIDKIDTVVDKYNNTYHSTITLRPSNVKSSTYIDSTIENIHKDPKFKVDDHVIISKYKKVAKGYTTNWSEEDFVIEVVKNTVSWIYVKNTLIVKKLLGNFIKPNKSNRV